MRSSKIFAAIAALALCATSAFAGEKIKLPTGPQTATPHVSAAVDQGSTPVTNVGWARRAARNGYFGGYGPYYTYRPYYSAPYYGGYYGGYGGYYTRPYYGYSYYSPGWYGYGPGAGVAFRTWGAPGTIWW